MLQRRDADDVAGPFVSHAVDAEHRVQGLFPRHVIQPSGDFTLHISPGDDVHPYRVSDQPQDVVKVGFLNVEGDGFLAGHRRRLGGLRWRLFQGCFVPRDFYARFGRHRLCSYFVRRGIRNRFGGRGFCGYFLRCGFCRRFRCQRFFVPLGQHRLCGSILLRGGRIRFRNRDRALGSTGVRLSVGQSEPYNPLVLFHLKRNGFMQMNPDDDLRLHVANPFHRHHFGHGAARVLHGKNRLLGAQARCLNVQGHVGRLVTLMGAYLRRRARGPHDNHRCIDLVFKGDVGYDRCRVAEEVRHRLGLPQGAGSGWRVRLQLGAASADAQGCDKPKDHKKDDSGKAHAHPPLPSWRRSGRVSGSEMTSFPGVT